MLTTKNNLEQYIQQWVTIDNQLKLLGDKTKELRDKKNILTEKICSENEELTVKINDGKLRVVQNKETQPLTFKFLETCLSEIIKNEDQVSQIVNYIKNKRDVKYVTELKRFYS